MFRGLIALAALVLWVIVAVNHDFPPPDFSQGTSAVSDGFLFGFMLLPKVIGQAALLGVSTLL